MPAGLLVTVPLPVPTLATLRVKVEAGCRLKVAVQLRFALIVTITAAVVAAQPVPAQAAKTEPKAGAAVNVAVVPLLKVPEQLVEQLIPAGELVMVPPPVPALVAVRLKVTTGDKLKVAVQLLLALIVTVTAGVVAAQPVPAQLAKTEPGDPMEYLHGAQEILPGRSTVTRTSRDSRQWRRERPVADRRSSRSHMRAASDSD